MKRIALETIDSTNEEAKRRFLAGEIAEPVCFTAEAQTAGKGTQGRRWYSPSGGLYVSVIHPAATLEAPREIPLTTRFTLSAGVACVEALQETLGLTVRLRPVNDLYADGRKLGGILTETIVGDGRIRALITGIGINLAPVDLPEDWNDCHVEPVGLFELLPAFLVERFSTEELLEAILERLAHWHNQVFDGQIAAVEQAYRTYQLPGTVLSVG